MRADTRRHTNRAHRRFNDKKVQDFRRPATPSIGAQRSHHRAPRIVAHDRATAQTDPRATRVSDACTRAQSASPRKTSRRDKHTTRLRGRPRRAQFTSRHPPRTADRRPRPRDRTDGSTRHTRVRRVHQGVRDRGTSPASINPINHPRRPSQSVVPRPTRRRARLALAPPLAARLVCACIDRTRPQSVLNRARSRGSDSNAQHEPPEP
jgi:hypothetical protein